MEGAVDMEHTVSKPHKLLCEFSDEDHWTLKTFSCCTAIALQLVCMSLAVDTLLSRLDKGPIYMFCPFQRQD